MALMTHEGSGLGNSERDLRKICKGAEIIKPMEIKFDSQGGPVLQTAENKINDWIAEVKRSLERELIFIFHFYEQCAIMTWIRNV